jgi:hypothetical protein
MTYFYKGVGVGTFLHATDLRTTGIAPARPTLSFSLSAAMLHVSSGVVMSPCISVTLLRRCGRLCEVRGSDRSNAGQTCTRLRHRDSGPASNWHCDT